jgi:hypothetical protein
VRLFSKIRQLTGRKLPLATLLEASTIDALAGLISKDETESDLTVPVDSHRSNASAFQKDDKNRMARNP